MASPQKQFQVSGSMFKATRRVPGKSNNETNFLREDVGENPEAGVQ
jgi:hypothetical protein